MTDLILRAPLAADVSALSALGQSSFVEKFGAMYRPQDLAAFLAETHSPEAVAAEMANAKRRYCVAEIAGTLAGYCKLALPSTLPQHGAAARPVEIKQLYTDPVRTGAGIGASLMDWALAEAKGWGADEVQLSVWQGNAGAQRFYARRGFAQVAEIHFWVGQQRDDEFLFARPL